MGRKPLLAVLCLGALCANGCGGGGGIAPPPSPTITSVGASCLPSSINTAQTSTCSATVTGTGSYSSAVNWMASGGTITSAGVFTPSATGTANVTATSTQDSTKSGSTGVTVTPVPITVTSVSVIASPGTITTAQTATCTASIAGTGAYTSAVTWTAIGGTITSGGVFTPSGVGTASCIANSAQVGFTNVSGAATITVTAPPTITSVSVSCSPTTLQENQTSQCGVTVQGTGSFDSTVTWATSLGTIASISKGSATYTAPPSTTGPASVTATSLEDKSKSGSTTLNVTLPPPSSTFKITAPGGGDIIGFAKDPTSPKKLYASIFDSGIYASSDGGSTWQKFDSNFPNSLYYGLIYQIAVSAQSGTVYVRYYASSGVSGGQVYKTSNGGKTWTQLSALPMPSTNLVTQIALDPINDSNLYLSDSAGAVYRSQDSGSTWSLITLPASCGSSIFPDVSSSGKIYYSSTCSGLYVSANFGGSWSVLSSKSNLGIGDDYGSGFFVQSNNDPHRFYASAINAGPLFDLVTSSDGGATWTKIADGYGLAPAAFDPTNASHAYMVASTLYPTTNLTLTGLLATSDGRFYLDAIKSAAPLIQILSCRPSYAPFGVTRCPYGRS